MCLFVSAYLATFVVLRRLLPLPGYWIALASGGVATLFCVAVVERGRWDLGLAARPSRIVGSLVRGVLLGGAVIGVTDTLVVLSTPSEHAPGRGFPWLEIFTIFVPAAVHEELVFRGYPYQKLREWSRGLALAISSVLFAGLHAGNSGITFLALLNIAVAGLLLALLYERSGLLWLPIGAHLMWNVASGPVLGYAVSGYLSGSFVEIRLAGPKWLTGGEFGIEGSAWILLVEIVVVAFLSAKRPAGWRRTGGE